MSETTQPKSEFTDCEGRTWKLRLTHGLAVEIKKATGVELGDEKNGEWVALLFGERGTLVSVLWCLCEKQAAEKGLTPEGFAYGFDGATLEAAGNALGVCVADFFPRSRISQALRSRWAEILQAGEEKAITAIMSAQLLGATNSPESSESIPPG